MWKEMSMIEVMIIIAIIGILIAMAVPNYITYKERSGCAQGKLEACRAMSSRVDRKITPKNVKHWQDVPKRSEIQKKKDLQEAGIETNESSDIICLNGVKVIKVGKKAYNLATIDDWGDLKPVTCE